LNLSTPPSFNRPVTHLSLILTLYFSHLTSWNLPHLSP
jgi:hypothetical protein